MPDFSKVRFCPVFFHFGTHGEHGKKQKGNGNVPTNRILTGNHQCGQADEKANDVLGCIR